VARRAEQPQVQQRPAEQQQTEQTPAKPAEMTDIFHTSVNTREQNNAAQSLPTDRAMVSLSEQSVNMVS
jgi:hypothetical protein